MYLLFFTLTFHNNFNFKLKLSSHKFLNSFLKPPLSLSVIFYNLKSDCDKDNCQCVCVLVRTCVIVCFYTRFGHPKPQKFGRILQYFLIYNPWLSVADSISTQSRFSVRGEIGWELSKLSADGKQLTRKNQPIPTGFF